MSELLRVFVYGTLKPGESNYDAYCASRIVDIQAALAYGELFDLPFDYPAMTAGDRPIYGYLLGFADPAVLEDLDELEGYSPHQALEDNEYLRDEIEVFSLDGQSLGVAWVYLMNLQQALSLGGTLVPEGKWTSNLKSNLPCSREL
ncbi:MAG TPA: gamma-glutamylcyclotransferase [Coleofasciculaceae cyanobacterium]